MERLDTNRKPLTDMVAAAPLGKRSRQAGEFTAEVVELAKTVGTQDINVKIRDNSAQ